MAVDIVDNRVSFINLFLPSPLSANLVSHLCHERARRSSDSGSLTIGKMRLCKNIHPALDGKFLEALHLRDIYTVTDFLRMDPERVVNFAAGSLDGDVEELREDLIEK